MKLREIKTKFGGKDVLFSLPDPGVDDPALPLYSIFQRIVHGTWSIADVKFVISMAYEGRGFHPAFAYGEYPRAVNEVFSSRPPATYVPLAGKVLEAYLFGLAPENAEFDEEA